MHADGKKETALSRNVCECGTDVFSRQWFASLVQLSLFEGLLRKCRCRRDGRAVKARFDALEVEECMCNRDCACHSTLIARHCSREEFGEKGRAGRVEGDNVLMSVLRCALARLGISFWAFLVELKAHVACRRYIFHTMGAHQSVISLRDESRRKVPSNAAMVA